MKPPLLATLLLAFFCLATAGNAVAQSVEEPTGAVVVGLGGAAGDAVSFNYDVRYPNQFGFQIGATLNPGDMDSEHEPGETERDPDKSYSLLGVGHFFVSEGPFALELGAGPVLQIDEGNLSMRAAGHVGVRVQPIFERFLLRVGYSPAIGADGYSGFVAVGVGYKIPF